MKAPSSVFYECLKLHSVPTQLQRPAPINNILNAILTVIGVSGTADVQRLAALVSVSYFLDYLKL